MVARAQQSGKIPRVGVLWHAGNEEEEAIYLGALRQGLNDLGYIEGKNIELLNRFADEHYERFDALARELVEAKVDVIIASVSLAALSAKRASSVMPVVFANSPDPIGQRLVDSLAHPGGNVTGFSNMATDLTAKQLELLRDCLPNLSRVMLLNNPGSPTARRVVEDSQAAARSVKVELSVVDVHAPDELERAFLIITTNRPDGVIISPDAMLYNERKRIAESAAANKLPTVGGNREMAEAGLLLSYGPDYKDNFRRAAIYADKILKGAKPGDLPVEQPTKFDLIVNIGTARAIGVTIPDVIQLLAEKVIE
jgi:putative ABC transport system substrate-binding protein